MAFRIDKSRTSLLPSALCSSPTGTITIYLRQPTTSSDFESNTNYNSNTNNPYGETSRKRARTSENDEEASRTSPSSTKPSDAPSTPEFDTTTDQDDDEFEADFENMPSFQVHIAALTAQSLYFKSLMSFNGLETSSKRVIFESPTNCSEELNKLAMQTLIDWLYTGSYNLSNYAFATETTRESDQKDTSGKEAKPEHKAVGEEMVFLAILYVLGERLLAEEFKKVVLKDMYEIMRVYQRAVWTPAHAQNSEQKLIVNSVLWEHIQRLIRIVFDGTSEKAIREPAADDIKTDKNLKMPAPSTLWWKSWLGREPMRNMVAGFAASFWVTPEAKEFDVAARLKILEDVPEFQKWLLCYLQIPGKRLSDLPRADFGVPEKDWWLKK
ncbi:hypothetical protein BJ508DRAFT_418936 [Ascobolus immersus RN42]|uniref:BTB domain-containing protein n=1 Tax=Ascobolus immersus RN42 TaxID=1160509 RepID=A0A3N4HVG3_ASCIM|nr:hypothetical protein BJ508DRAFT_418936 [Ascobolus immersus RN42]